MAARAADPVARQTNDSSANRPKRGSQFMDPSVDVTDTRGGKGRNLQALVFGSDIAP